MKPTLPTLLALALSAPLAAGQLITPTGQDRTITASADADGGTPMTETDSAADFGPFQSSVSASASGSGGNAMSAASQDSQILADSFLVSGTQSCSSFSDADSSSETRAMIEFDVPVRVAYRVVADYESYDNGFFSYDLWTASGQWISGWIGIAEGQQSIEHWGALDPGSYRIEFRADGASEYAFADFNAAMHLVELAANYCVGAPNSVGAGAKLAVGGTHSIASNDFRIDASGVVPSVAGIVFYGSNQTQVSFGDGFRCVAGGLYRVHPVVMADANGDLSKPIDFTSGSAGSGSGQILAWSTWNFQLWYRDPQGSGGSGFNTSDALQASFYP